MIYNAHSIITSYLIIAFIVGLLHFLWHNCQNFSLKVLTCCLKFYLVAYFFEFCHFGDIQGNMLGLTALPWYFSNFTCNYGFIYPQIYWSLCDFSGHFVTPPCMCMSEYIRVRKHSWSKEVLHIKWSSMVSHAYALAYANESCVTMWHLNSHYDQ